MSKNPFDIADAAKAEKLKTLDVKHGRKRTFVYRGVKVTEVIARYPEQHPLQVRMAIVWLREPFGQPAFDGKRAAMTSVDFAYPKHATEDYIDQQEERVRQEVRRGFDAYWFPKG